MTRPFWTAAVLTVLIGWVATEASAASATVNVGVKKYKNRCVTFSGPSPGDELKTGDTLTLFIRNEMCARWNIRIDRLPSDSFAGDCMSVAGAFTFEADNPFNTGEVREVRCMVKREHRTDTYVFDISASQAIESGRGASPHGSSTSEPCPQKAEPKSNLAVEVDP